MRTDSHRLTGSLVALAFLGGWFSASWVSPPTAVTQVRPARPVVPPPEVPMPHIALDAVTAPETAPAAARNPFMFAPGLDAAATNRLHAARISAVDGPPRDADGVSGGPVPAAADTAPVAPVWRVFGIAHDADGRYTAVVSGGGDVLLLGMGDRLPDGAVVVEIDATGVIVAETSGARLALRLP